jgi:hypothetical protein
MSTTSSPRAAPRAALLFGVVLLATAGAPVSVIADQDDDAERVPSSAGQIYSPIERTFDKQPALPGGPRQFVAPMSEPQTEPVLFQDLKDRLRYADPLFRDMRMSFYTRTHALDLENGVGPPSKAWALGAALGLRTGFLDDWLQFEIAAATSQPLWAPEGEGGTLLLTDNQAEVSSLGIANAHMRGFGQELTIGRQLVKTPYINPQDNRMIPNAVEGVALMRRRDEAQTLDYGFGYLWGFKARDSSYFVPFSEELGVEEDRGVAVAGAKVMPAKGLTLGGIDYLIPDVLNTAFTELDWIVDAAPVQVRFSVNYTDQRTVGADLIAGAPYDANQVAARFAASYANATFLVAASRNGNGAALQNPFGSFPAYTVLDQLNFNAAGQETVVIGAAYDFSNILLDGLKLQTRYGWSWGAQATTDTPAGRQNEYNLELEYLPTYGPLKNVHVQVFYSAVAFPDNPPGETQQPQVRGVVTYLIPLL